MKKRIIIAAAFTACLALCAAVWPQTSTVRENTHAASNTPVSAPAPAQAVTDLHPSNMVYVEGFGWLEYQRSNRYEYGADIYENGDKIGIMG